MPRNLSVRKFLKPWLTPAQCDVERPIFGRWSNKEKGNFLRGQPSPTVDEPRGSDILVMKFLFLLLSYWIYHCLGDNNVATSPYTYTHGLTQTNADARSVCGSSPWSLWLNVCIVRRRFRAHIANAAYRIGSGAVPRGTRGPPPLENLARLWPPKSSR